MLLAIEKPNAYLQDQCGALVGNSTGGGICTCPGEIPLTPLQPATF